MKIRNYDHIPKEYQVVVSAYDFLNNQRHELVIDGRKEIPMMMKPLKPKFPDIYCGGPIS